MDLSKKNDWSSVYFQPTPAEYLLHAKKNEYNVPDFACQFIRPLLLEQAAKLQRSINVMDLGASYGIMSSLLQFDMTFEQLTDFFVAGEQTKSLGWTEIEGFFNRHNQKHQQQRFCLTDISQPAMDFATRLNLCERAFCLDMSQGTLTNELRETIAEIDLYIAVGSLAYIGDAFFADLLPIIKRCNSSPFFAFAVYRAFYPQTLEQLFNQYGYKIQQLGVPLKKGRKFANSQEQQWAISRLHQRQVATTGFEDEGYYACEFLLAAHEDNDQWYKERGMKNI